MKRISDQLKAIMKSNFDLVRDFAAKTVQIQGLKAENIRLRQQKKGSNNKTDIVHNVPNTTIRAEREIRLSEPSNMIYMTG